jgi:alpha-1,3-rhamnosyl/mannosyltransferase
MRLYPELTPDKVSVVPLAVDPALHRAAAIADSAAASATVRSRYSLPARFVLHVGTIEPRKNVGAAIDAVTTIRATHPDVELVLVGQPGWESRALFARIAETAGVRHLGHVPSSDLPALYQAAAALVMPSHYEGFGLPVLEAMALGTPVVSSGKGSLAEVGGTAALVPEDHTPDGYARALGRILSSEPLRDELRARGLAQASRFSWAAAAKATAAVYERVLRSSRT